MKKNYIARRRGTSVAAAALSFALVAPFASPVAGAQENGGAGTVEAADAATPEQTDPDKKAQADTLDEGTLDDYDPKTNPSGWTHAYWVPGKQQGPTQPKLLEDGTYDVDAIASGQITRGGQLTTWTGAGYDVVSGRATIVNPRFGGQLTAVYPGFESIPDNIPVRFQWIDDDGAVSPVYTAQTHDLPGLGAQGGAYAFAVPQWIDATGKKHRFRAALGQKFRIWFEPDVNPDTGNKLVPLRNAPGMVPQAFSNTGNGDLLGEFGGAVNLNGNMTKTAVWAYELPTSGKAGNENYMLATGERFYEDNQGPIKNPTAHMNQTFGADTPYAGQIVKRTVSGKVWLENGNERQLFSGATATGNAPAKGYRVFASALTDEGAKQYDAEVGTLPPDQRDEATKAFIERNPQFLAGTVSGPVADNGEYTLRFPEAIFANNFEAALSDEFQNHLYMWVEDENEKVVPTYSTFTQPVFQNPRNNLQWAPTVDPRHNNAFSRSRFDSVNFAVVPNTDIELEITNYDTLERPAKPGSVARLKLKGDLPKTDNFIEWRDANNRVLKRCAVTPPGTADADLNGCDWFRVPDDVNRTGKFFTAVLTNGANEIAADSFVVVIEGPAWGDTRQTPGKDAVTLPNIGEKANDRAKTPQGLPEPPVFVLKDKDGNEITDPEQYLTWDEKTGDITFTPADALSTNDGDRYTVEVYRLVDKLDEDGNKIPLDNSQNPQYEKTEEFIDDATIYYLGVANDFAPEYPGYIYPFPSSEGTWSKSSTDADGNQLRPKFYKSDADGNPVVDESGNRVEVARNQAQLAQEKNDNGVEVAPFRIDVDNLPEFWMVGDEQIPANWNVKADGQVSQPGDVSVRNDGWVTFIPGAQGVTNDAADAGKRAELKEKLGGASAQVPVIVTYKDGSEDRVWVDLFLQNKLTDRYDLAYDAKVAEPDQEVTIDPVVTERDGKKVNVPDRSKFALKADENGDPFTAPEGYTVKVDPKTGVVTVTTPANATADTVEQFDVPVVITYDDGSTDEANARVQLDTDGDGIPDVEDDDDDNDGVPDGQEAIDGTNPKDPKDFKERGLYEPRYTPADGRAGGEVTIAAPEFTDSRTPGQAVDNPGAKFSAPGEVSGAKVTVNPDTGEVKVTVPEGAKTGDRIDVPVTVTYQDGSTDEVVARVNVTNQADQFDPSYGEPKTIKPGKSEVAHPGNTPEGTTFAPADEFEVPEGYTVVVDPQTGKVTVTAPEKPTADTAEEVKVPVVVTYPDGTSERVEVVFQLDTDGDGIPDVEDDDDDNDGVSDEDEEKAGSNPKNKNSIPATKLTPATPGNTDGNNNGGDGNTGDNTNNDTAKKPTSVDESSVETVKPTDDEQPTGIKVNDKDGDTKITATDEDGNNIPVRIDDDGKVFVTPGEGVDGPITVVITDPDLPGGKAEILVPVEGHEEGRDDNDSNTSVDSSNVNEVQRTDDEQNTGVKVNNPTQETEVDAFDEDGKKIPVRIDEDGNVLVIPGTDVDGPITVIVKDPSLPGGQTEVKVPVVGHEENKDDNGNGNPGTNPVSVDDSNVNTLDPNDDSSQDTGIVVKNPTDKTTVEAKDEDGNDVFVEIDGDGKISVNPTKDSDGNDIDVDGPVTVIVKDPNLPGGQRTIVVPVEGHADGRDDNFSDAKPNFGGQRTEVKPDGKGTSRDPFQGKDVKIDKATITDGDASKGGWKFEVDEKTGVVTGTAPKTDELRQLFDREFKNNQPKDWNDFVKRFKNTGQPDVDVTFDFPGNRGDETATAGFDLIGQDGKSIFDPNGDFDGDGKSNFDELFGDGVDWSKNTPNPFGPQATLQFEGNGKNVVADGEPHIVGKVNLPAGTTGTIEGIPGSKVEVDENGNVSVTVPDNYIQPDGDAIWGRIVFPGVDLGDARVRIVGKVNVGKCIASSVGFGLPLLALIPLGLAITVGLPGLEPQIKQFNKVIEDANTSLQRQLGIFNPEMARQAAEVNAQLKQVGMNLLTGAGILLLIPLAVGGAFSIANGCTPGGLSEAFGSSDNS
ncbi:YPDG domain-containing protein [Corynebacterium sp. Marseille-P4321]|uniref:YPDG domain-containing protein n=1 Tax=Corynebacterium sp. Marseille-P4321 TaxID=2736603 RepID=UPI00158AEA47|nr:YPDG domain-containing protein [Corynebacterium sp. Marseille-P4321]